MFGEKSRLDNPINPSLTDLLHSYQYKATHSNSKAAKQTIHAFWITSHPAVGRGSDKSNTNEDREPIAAEKARALPNATTAIYY